MHIPTPEEIRARRVMLGLTQTGLARKAGISQSMIARIESGSVDPRVSTLTRIVAVLSQAEKPPYRAGEVMHTPVYTVGPGEPVSGAVEIMEKNDVSQLPVIDGGVPVGCISESAIVSALEEGGLHGSGSRPVRDFMEPGFPTVPLEADVRDVVHLLRENHAVLVVDGGRVAGVITKHDLIPLFS
ncbi:MAG TPA: CBS domain-containing protein [Methanomicrobiales archaeon]|nr:CBS domain-containing protein [Methanomicrobiales archaeon]